MSELASRFAQTKIIVLGDVILDSYIMGEVTRISPEAPVPIVKVNRRAKSLGGAGNVALNLRGLGCAVALLSVRGPDESGESVSGVLKDKGIKDCLLVDPDHTTTTKTRILGQNQQLVRLDEEVTWHDTENYRDELMTAFRAELADANVVILSDYHKGVLNGPLTQAAIQECKKAGIPALVDPKRKNWERYFGATCITPNISELEEMYGKGVGSHEALLNAVRALKKEFRIEWFLATRGPEGMCLLGPDDQPLFISATQTEVYDVSGAGDTVISTFAAAIAGGFQFKEAAILSNLAAGVVVRKLGAQPITIGELETESRTAQQGGKTSSSGKISALEPAQLQVKSWQSVGHRVGVAFGSFELLHPGNIYFLNQARKLGNRLLIILQSGEKGHPAPILSSHERASVLSALSAVDLVVLSDEEAQSVVKKLAPDFVAAHSEEERIALEESASKVETVVPLPGYSASEIFKRAF